MPSGGGIRADVDYREFAAWVREATRAASPQERQRYLRNAGAIMMRMEDRIFKSDGGELGIRWRALSETTIRMRRQRRNLGGPGNKRGKGMQILRDTGTLRNSVAGGSMQGGPRGSIREIRPLEVKVGTRLEYARAHQYGLPARTIPNVKVRAHRRRVKSRGVRGLSSGVAFVSEHTRTQKWGAVPARPFVGWTQWGIGAVVAEAVRHFVTEPDLRSR